MNPEGWQAPINPATAKTLTITQTPKAGLIYGLEVEANLVGQNGRMLAALAKAVGRSNLVCIFDGGNISSQNLSPLECLCF